MSTTTATTRAPEHAHERPSVRHKKPPRNAMLLTALAWASASSSSSRCCGWS